MCRLFACIAKEPVNMNFSFFEAPHPFKDLIKTNKHGWGIGRYDEKGSAKVFKEGIKKSGTMWINIISRWSRAWNQR